MLCQLSFYEWNYVLLICPSARKRERVTAELHNVNVPKTVACIKKHGEVVKWKADDIGCGCQ